MKAAIHAAAAPKAGNKSTAQNATKASHEVFELWRYLHFAIDSMRWKPTARNPQNAAALRDLYNAYTADLKTLLSDGETVFVVGENTHTVNFDGVSNQFQYNGTAY
jgi:hypothetical protein